MEVKMKEEMGMISKLKNGMNNPDIQKILSIALNVFTKILTQRIELKVEICDEEQSCSQNIYTLDAMFILRHLAMKGTTNQ